MWIALSILSALMLGFYDVAKKQSLRRNSVLWVLFVTTSISTLLMAPFASAGPLKDHLLLAVKALLVSVSWISGLAAMNLIPLTTLSSLKASRPVFVVLLSCIMFGERLTLWQWVGVGLVFGALLLLSKESAKEGIAFSHSRGVAYAWVAVFTGVASALFDKYLLGFAEPLFVQFWSDLYISVIMLLCLLVQAERGKAGKFKWDWTLALIALLITGADASYFFALESEGSLLSVVSLVRRASILVTFAVGALVFRENRIAGKSVALSLLLGGIAVLCVTS